MQRNTLLSLLPRTVAFGLFLAHVAAPIGLDMAEGPALTVKAAHAQMRDRQQMRDGSCRTADCLNRQQLDRLRLGQEGVTPRTDRPAADGERPIYGSQMMTEQERLDYRSRMRNAQSSAEREQIRAEHHAEMQARARAQGVTLPSAPPARGMGAREGMGPGGVGPGGMGGGAMRPEGMERGRMGSGSGMR